jgi:hypothetical protein
VHAFSVPQILFPLSILRHARAKRLCVEVHQPCGRPPFPPCGLLGQRADGASGDLDRPVRVTHAVRALAHMGGCHKDPLRFGLVRLSATDAEICVYFLGSVMKTTGPHAVPEPIDRPGNVLGDGVVA